MTDQLGSAADAPAQVLLAEDNLLNQRVVALMLRKLGHRVDIVDNGAKAVEACRSSNYLVVFMDINMPTMNGLEATKRIVSTVSISTRPYIVAYTAGADLQDCLAAGMDNYLAKPVTTQDIAFMMTQGEEAAARRRSSEG
jgi:CheY-like chemotaxis protein